MKQNRSWLFILPLLLVAAFVAYYSFFYKSERVEGGIFKAEKIFTAHTAQVRSVRFTPDGEYVVTGSVDSTVQIWKKNGEIVRTLKHPEGVTHLDVSPDGNYIVTGSYDATVRLWSIADGILLKTFSGHSGTVWSVAFSPDGNTIATSGEDKVARLWDVTTGRLIRKLPGHRLTIWSVKFSPGGNTVATGSFDATIRLWETTSGKLLQAITGHDEAVVDIAFSHDGKILASTSDDKTIRLWSMPGAKLIRSMEVAEHVQAAVFSPDDQYLLTAGRDKPAVGELLQEFFGDSEMNKGVSMRLWKVGTGELVQTFAEHSNDVNDVAWSKQGWIASAGEDKVARLWRMAK